MNVRLAIASDGSVTDPQTGALYGRIRAERGSWVGKSSPRIGREAVEVFRPTRYQAALAVAANYVLGYEG